MTMLFSCELPDMEKLAPLYEIYQISSVRISSLKDIISPWFSSIFWAYDILKQKKSSTTVGTFCICIFEGLGHPFLEFFCQNICSFKIGMYALFFFICVPPEKSQHSLKGLNHMIHKRKLKAYLVVFLSFGGDPTQHSNLHDGSQSFLQLGSHRAPS